MLVKINNNRIEKYPYSIVELKVENKNISFPAIVSNELLAEYGIYEVVVTEKPQYDKMLQKVLIENTPSLVGGLWTLSWMVVNKTAEELEIQRLAQVPKVITMAQCREQLILMELDDDVEAILASIPDPIKQKIYKSAWEYNTVVKLDNVMLLELAPLLSIDLEQFFIDASKLC